MINLENNELDLVFGGIACIVTEGGGGCIAKGVSIPDGYSSCTHTVTELSYAFVGSLIRVPNVTSIDCKASGIKIPCSGFQFYTKLCCAYGQSYTMYPSPQLGEVSKASAC
jgi:hypothetical protein